MRAAILVGSLMVFAALAGCTGDFRIQQTEPLRIQVDGASQSGRVAASDSCETPCTSPSSSEFAVETDPTVEKVKVVVVVKKVTASTTTTNTTGNETGGNETSDPCEVLVTVEDRDSGQKLAEKNVVVNEDSANAELDIDVKGKNNVVVVTQAVQGIADVDVAAQTSSSSSGDQTMGSTSPSASASNSTASPTYTAEP